MLDFESEEWSSQLINFQFKPLERRSLKLQRDSNPWPPRYPCDALPTELWSHTLGARSIERVHISREEWNDVRYLRNRKHVPCFYRVIQIRVEVWENEKSCGNTSRRRVFPQLFRVLPNFHEFLYNSIETRSTCFLFLLENNATRKRKATC